MTDERQGLPSASYIAQIDACNGSWEAQQGLTDIVEDESAKTGTQIHDWLEAKVKDYVSEPLKPVDQATADECWNLLQAERAAYFGAEAPREIHGERRLWLLDDESNPILSAKLDYLEVCENKALVVDYKTGWEGAEEAASNLQLRTQALTVETWFPVEHVRVVIISPHCKPQVTVSDYTNDDLRKSHAQIVAIVNSAKGGKRTPGQQCRWCRAKHVCPEALAVASALPETVGMNSTADISSRANGNMLRQRLADMSPDQLGKLADDMRVGKWVINQVEQHIKRRILSGEKVPGWVVNPGSSVRTVTSAAEALKRINGPAATLTLDQFLACVSVKISELDAVFKSATSLKSTDAKAELERRLGDVIERKTDQPSLERE